MEDLPKDPKTAGLPMFERTEATMRIAIFSLLLTSLAAFAAKPGGKITGSADMQRQGFGVISRIHVFGQERDIFPARGLVSNEVTENGPVGAIWEGEIMCLVVSDALRADGVVNVTAASDGSGGPHPNPSVFPGQKIWFRAVDGGEPSMDDDDVHFSVITEQSAFDFCTCIKIYDSADACDSPNLTADWVSIGKGNIQVHPR